MSPCMISGLEKRTCGVWDLDNTLYPDCRPDGSRISLRFVESFLHTANVLLPDLGDDLVVDRMTRSFLLCGMSCGGFSDIAPDYGYAPKELMEALHSTTGRRWFEIVTRDYPDHFSNCPDTISLFSLLSDQMRHGCLTHSCSENWAAPVLKRLGYARFFETVMGPTHYDFESKQLSTRPLKIALEKLGAEPHEAFFVEDSLRNLEKAKDLSSRLLTVLVHHGHPPDVLPPYVDLAIENPKVLLAALLEAHQSHRPGLWIPSPTPPVSFAPVPL